eukprot:COSAG01_NODE_71707_length_255_cov_0.653846_2_plen_35_part_01
MHHLRTFLFAIPQLEKQIIGDMVSVRNQPSFCHCV